MGVPLFFVLSGYLIGGQLWAEIKQRKTVDMKKFFIRRTFRIWPLYYFVLAIFLIFPAFPKADLIGKLSNIFFLSNYISDNGAIPTIFWSLSTEEHFYIVGPLALIFCQKFFKIEDIGVYLKPLIALFFLPTFLRIITWKFFLGDPAFDIQVYGHYIYRPFHTHCEGLIGGMILSNLHHTTGISFNIKKGLANWFLTLALACLGLAFVSKVYLKILGISIGFVVLTWYLLSYKSWLSKLFSHWLFFPIAKTSFALYLIHYPVVKHFYIVIAPKLSMSPFWVQILCLTYTTIISLFLSMILFHLIENPFLKLRRKFIS